MTDERILNALADVRVELFRGNNGPSMINEIASDYGLAPQALAERLVKAYGSLADLEERQSKSDARNAIEARMKAAIHEYARTEAGCDIAKWLSEKAGREPTRQEVEYTDELWMHHQLAKLMSGQ